MRNLLIAYVLCAAGLLTPFAGLHRFYFRRPVSGFFYLITWGFFGIGTIVDLIRMPTLIEDFNVHEMFCHHVRKEMLRSRGHLTSKERAILKCANDNCGIVTVPMVTLSSGLSMQETKEELEKLFRHGFCQKDVDEEGNETYEFKGLNVKKPLI